MKYEKLAIVNNASARILSDVSFDHAQQVKDLIEAAPRLLTALKDCVQSLERLPDVDGAYRVTCINQAKQAIANATPPKQSLTREQCITILEYDLNLDLRDLPTDELQKRAAAHIIEFDLNDPTQENL